MTAWSTATTTMPLSVASSSAGVDAGRIGRVDDDGVDAGADQVADVLELAGRIGVAVRDVELGDLAGGERLRLDRADHLLAPAIALHGVGDADRVAVLAPRAGRTPRRRARGRRSGSMARYLAFRMGTVPFLHLSSCDRLSRSLRFAASSFHIGPKHVAGEQEAALHQLVAALEPPVLVLDDDRPVIAGAVEAGEDRRSSRPRRGPGMRGTCQPMPAERMPRS